MHPSGYKTKFVANEIGHPQYRVTAFLSSGLITFPNEIEASGHHMVDTPAQKKELSVEALLDLICSNQMEKYHKQGNYEPIMFQCIQLTQSLF